MTMRAAWVALALAVWACGAVAQAPEVVLRPVARAEPEPPGRPEARPQAGDAVPSPVDEAVTPDASAGPVVLADPPVLGERPDAADDTPPAILTDAELAAPRGAPAFEVVVMATDDADGLLPMPGPRQMVMAESFMQDPPPPPVFVDGWTGDAPPARPGTAEVVSAPGASDFLRPEARPETLPQVERTTIAVALRPRARPAAPTDPAPLVTAAPDAAPVYGVGAEPGAAPEAPQFSILAVAHALRPPARTARVIEQASTVQRETVRGMVCGNPDIQGEVLAAIRDGGGCGVEEPVRIRSIGGIRLTTASVMDCNTAEALNSWVQSSARPIIGGTGGGLVGLDIMGSYTCRPRNNQAGARLSEHGKGKAVDIGGFILANGQEITVLNGWGTQSFGEQLRALHRSACGPFGTVLGPNANAQHRNHFHFDTASYRNGTYCR